MATLTATLVIRFKTEDGKWKYAAPAKSANGRLSPGCALLPDGTTLKVQDYGYYVRHYEDRKPKYILAGTNVHQAETMRRQTEERLSAIKTAQQVGVKVEVEQTRKTLAASAAEYVKDARDRGATEATLQAESVTAEFIKVARKTYVDEIDRQDVLAFHKALRKRGCGDRTVANKHARLKSWFLFAGVDRSIMPPAPKYEEALPTIYELDTISTLLGQAEAEGDAHLHLLIQVAHKTGLRDKELMHLEFSDINWRESTLRVRGKSKWGFKVKDSEQRDVPVPADIAAELMSWREKRQGKTLVLGTDSDQPNYKMLRAVKRLAKRAGLNCKHCPGCKSSNNECREFSLHKFRRTYITTLLRRGFDLRTVQAYAGHADLTSTMRYLRPASAKEVHERLNAMEW
jgi:integrase